MAYRQTAAVEARLQDNRTRILRVARSLVSEGGWREAQVASVAAAAGIATGTVYRYFPSKAELFAEVLSAVSQREVDVLAEIAATHDSALGRLRSAVATFVRRAMRNPRLAYALIAEPCDKEIDEVRLVYRAAISEVIRAIVASGQSSGEMTPDMQPEIAASVIVGGFMEGLIGPLSPLSRQQHQDTDDYQREVAMLADQIARLACASVSASSASPATVRKLSRRPP
ncbi:MULTISPECIES: TetR/AcrR family transcriptional regulator [Variovorax]|jgi:AcrR family transcriptional regulator|uniref:TetR/AcrR family transcriptional regulator n=1 Tax=Variovorax TaxID=34072 RepID=UPI00086B95D3|nr:MULTISPECIES: TetR/AcrR family transcriptional regulator [Variovorax]MBN8753188.1 TetR/AcrR family transcriptional regulator [Variovorax sp.]ODU11535.1 MAG: TetR family transcriptional regulator [Variovorax sp. SCN 67-85]ODV15100.1 MAG: TetR family transcriptional regulator [Variovorax sp. SCN 67-20]OJZ11999.1 MAG: TetR family transcriptional regulator [Variovorax sp. 67-131]UKI05389.1 TetR/AcrR family transcriptional regulator [Variovorax paradoxus]